MDKATTFLGQAAESGVSAAQYTLGCMLLDTPPQDTEEKKWAAHWLNKAAEQGNMKAQLTVGRMFLFGVGVEEDPAAAAEWTSAAASSGEPEAEYMMACLLLTGTGVEANPEWSKHWLENAARKGIVDAGRCMEWLQCGEVARAEALAAYHLGMLGIEEQGAPSRERAQRLLISSAEKGEADAQYMLGKICFFLYVPGLPRHGGVLGREAGGRSAADPGRHAGPRPRTGPGGQGAHVRHRRREGRAQGRRVYHPRGRERHEGGPVFDGLDAARGQGGPGSDKPLAAQWFEKAALQGHQNAQYNLSQMLATGDGIEMDRRREGDLLAAARRVAAPRSAARAADARQGGAP
ncbi:unnamed protein product [Prorocentrum cordatum]|uniref:Sel1 repeat family protein n=1 Tax=Prorocentrum cordatum TaxID=2364126 RepID=A0ABN9Q4Y3_9DINO|nr:unnamed protein product [Polarella glacialis]